MVKLRNLEPLITQGLELAFRIAHGAADQTLEAWLAALPDPGARLLAIDELIAGDDRYEECIKSENAQAFRVAYEVLSIVSAYCRDPEPSLDDIINELDRGSPP